jgi:hypothetical protein
MAALLAIAATLAATSGKACASTFAGDSKVETCASFCSANSLKAHCPRCKCKACDFCASLPPPAPAPKPLKPKACSSGLAGDSSVTDCHQYVCDQAGDNACAYCQCKHCSKCVTHAANVAKKKSKGKSSDENGSDPSVPTTKLGKSSTSGGGHHASKSTVSSTTPGTSPAVVVGAQQSKFFGKRFDFYCTKASCDPWCRKEFAHHQCVRPWIPSCIPRLPLCN